MGSRYGSGGPQGKNGLLVVTLALALVGCGRAGDLRPPPGQPLPVKPKVAATTPTPDDLLALPPIARPQRVDEILRRSEPRRPDRFDLPPPSGANAAVEPEGEADPSSNTRQTRVQEPE